MTGGQLAEHVADRDPLTDTHPREDGLVSGTQTAIMLDAYHPATGDPTGVRDNAAPRRSYRKAHAAGQVDPSMPG